MSVTEPERFLSPRQLASYLNVFVATVYDWRHRRCGPPGFRLGKHVRYRRSDVDRWIDDQIEGGASAVYRRHQTLPPVSARLIDWLEK